jgi:hypothetical protein
MAESATTTHPKRLEEIELRLLRDVAQTGAIWTQSQKGQRQLAALQYRRALQVFAEFIFHGKIPKG